MKNYTATDDRYKTLGDTEVSDEVIIERLKKLPTVIDMPFNQIVRSYIERYTKYGRAQVAALLGLSHYYMPIFEQALEAQGLPLELKYLPVIESALDPNAVSRHGATGLWQFMLGAAKGLGLEVNSLVDERRDPYLSSETAAAFLKDLYSTYGDWSLAIAAYNCGPGTVNKAIRRAGGDPSEQDFWSIYSYLPSETRGYVPMFIAANYVMTYYKDHNISPVVITKPLVTDTVCVNQRLHFNQISKVLDIPVEELRILNPQFRADLIPGSQDSPYYLILPSQQIHAYIMSEKDIMAYDAEKYARRITASPGDVQDDFVAQVEESADDEESARGVEEIKRQTAVQQTQAAVSVPASPAVSSSGGNIVHKVVAGESLASIAAKYNVSPADIKTWNNLRRNAVRTGQQLRIQTASAPAPASRTQSAQTAPKAKTTAQGSASAQSSAKNGRVTETASAAKKDRTSTRKEKTTQQGRKKEKAKVSKPTKHTVKEGENLTVIAKRSGVSVEELKKANNMTNDNLRAGKDIVIPAKSTSGKGSKASASKSGKSTSKSGKGTSSSKSSKSKKGSKKKKK